MGNLEASNLHEVGESILEEWRLDLSIARQMVDLYVYDPPKATLYKERVDYLERFITKGVLFQNGMNQADLQQYYETMGEGEIK